MNRHLLAVTFAFLLGADCEEAPRGPTSEPFRVTFRAQSDGEPLPGVMITVDHQLYGETNDQGILRADIVGVDGQAVFVDAQPPTQFRPPERTPVLHLRAFEATTPTQERNGIEILLDCPPRHRKAVVIVRANGLARLPVLYRGEPIARTDRSGVAHVFLRLGPTDRFQLQLDTSDRERIRPRSPRSPVFELADEDRYFVFDAPVEEEPLPPPPPPEAPPPPSGPRIPRRF